MGIYNCCGSVKKKTEKLLIKMFGYKTIKDGLGERKRLADELELSAHKPVSEFSVNDIRRNPCLYARYKTIDKVLSIYIDLVGLDRFTGRV